MIRLITSEIVFRIEYLFIYDIFYKDLLAHTTYYSSANICTPVN